MEKELKITQTSPLGTAIIEYLTMWSNDRPEVLDLEPFRVKESLSDMVAFLKSLEAEVHLGDMDTNGWQCDMFLSFTYQDEEYFIEFEAFYNTMKLHFDGY